MPKLTQDFNIFPYFDDYDETKSFYKILFRPGYSVQARELTQIQSILQNQIEKTGDVLFQDGSKVSGGELTINTSINSLQVLGSKKSSLTFCISFIAFFNPVSLRDMPTFSHMIFPSFHEIQKLPRIDSMCTIFLRDV